MEKRMDSDEAHLVTRGTDQPAHVITSRAPPLQLQIGSYEKCALKPFHESFIVQVLCDCCYVASLIQNLYW